MEYHSMCLSKGRRETKVMNPTPEARILLEKYGLTKVIVLPRDDNFVPIESWENEIVEQIYFEA